MLTDCLTCQKMSCCDQQDRWDDGCINYKMMPTKNPTNGDRIRSMSDEELAERFFLFPCVHVLDDKVICKDDGCKKCWMRWLREEVKE